MIETVVDQEIQLIPYYPNPEVALAWYQDKDVCKQVDNTEELYSLEKLTRMYDYLNQRGNCYYIQYNGVLVGDITLKDDAEIDYSGAMKPPVRQPGNHDSGR